MKSKLWIFVALVVVIATLGAQCGAAPTPEKIVEKVIETVVVKETVEVIVAGTPEVMEKEVIKEVVVTATPEPRTVVIALTSEPVTLDPGMHTDLMTMKMMTAYSDALIWFGPGGSYRPALAESWELTDDRTWRFHLRKGVTFTNGEPFNAEVVKYTAERIMDPANNSPAANTVTGSIEEIRVVDDYTVEIVTKEPYPGLLSDLGNMVMVPPKYVEEVGNEEFAQNPVGLGAFKFVEWVPGDHLTFTANEDYWGGRPSFETLIFRPILEESTATSALLAGEVDIIMALSPENVEQIEEDPCCTVQGLSGARQVYLAMDAQTPPFDDIRVRQAMNYAIDVDAIMESILAGQGVRATGGFVPMVIGYDETVPAYPYDPEKAKDLLTEAGYGDGFDVDLNVTLAGEGIINTADLAEAVQSYLAELGVNVEIVIHENAVFWEKYHASGFAGGMYIASWGGGLNEGRYLMPLFHSQTRGYYYQNPEETDPLLEACSGTVDFEARREACSKVQWFLYEEVPWVFLYGQPQLFGVSKYIVWGGTREDYLIRPIEIESLR